MPRYRLSERTPQIIRDNEGEYAGGLRVVRKTVSEYFLECCGLAGLEGFGKVMSFRDWKDEAEYMACLYRTMYDKGTVIYTLNHQQLQNHLHLVMCKLGSHEIATFPNKYWGSKMIHVFLFSVRNIAGRYCDRKGNAYDEPPEGGVYGPDVIAEQTEVGPQADVNYNGGFAKLPT